MVVENGRFVIKKRVGGTLVRHFFDKFCFTFGHSAVVDIGWETPSLAKTRLSVIKKNCSLCALGKQQRFKDVVTSVAITVHRSRFAKCFVSLFFAR